MSRFRDDFVWGVSTSAYQIEGGITAEGRGESIWDTFAAKPGTVSDGSDGSVATDHYHRWEEDLDLLAELGVGAYRFSVAWPRVQPAGRGKPSRAGLDFYERIIDGLRGRGIAPWICLYHWDLPQALQDKGGWANRDTAAYFADYAEHVASAFGDRVDHIFTFNEPNVHAVMGHLLGLHAPGKREFSEFLACIHHQNLATGMAVQRLRAAAPSVKVGTILNLQPVVPALPGEEHEAAARLVDAAYNRSALDPLFRGTYPEAIEGLMAPYVRGGDLDTASTGIDVLGVNHYTRLYVTADPQGPAGLALAEPPAGRKRTAMGWEVAPDALLAQLRELKDDYGNPPVVITENGAAFPDLPGPDGRIDDRDRASYLAAYLRAVGEAVDAGCDVRGYFVWTLVDNFEWGHGFDRRFGLVHLNRESLERTPKSSFEVYREIVAGNRAPEYDSPEYD